jgi:DNA repair exonuclease SbcCD nuclease subunit
VVEQFNLLGSNSIPVCLIPGTHDSLDSSSIYRKVDFEARCPNLKVFAGENISFQEYPNLDLTVYGRPNLSNRSSVSPLKGLRRSTSSKFQIAMAHGSLYIPEKIAEDDHVFKLDEIEASGMHYLALGHWHRIYRCPVEPPAWYAGPPEWIPGQTDKGGVLLVSLSDIGEAKVEPRMLGLRDYDEVEIDVGGVQDLAMLRARISEGANQNLIRQATLKGLRDAELIVSPEELETDLRERFFHVKVSDESHVKVKEISESTYEGQLIKAKFIRLMNETIANSQGEEKEIAENALQYGLIFLDGKEV